MKIRSPETLVILLLLLQLPLLSQTFSRPDDKLIKKYRIHRINVYQQDSAGKKPGGSWEYDPRGNLTAESSEGTSTVHFYSNNLLLTTVNQVSAPHQPQVDTINYLYDQQGRTTERTIKKFMGGGRWTQVMLTRFRYSYPGKNVTTRKVEHYESENDRTPDQPGIFYDTLCFDAGGLLLSETFAQFENKTVYTYNKQKQLTRKSLTTAHGQVRFSFTYQNGRLHREEVCYVSEPGKCNLTEMWHYSYDRRGLIHSIRSDAETKLYEYEFYE